MNDETEGPDLILVAVLGFLSVPLVLLAIAAAWMWEPLAYGH